ncbi:MAG: exosortase/archaeosortase family protein [Phycisphaerales bacterium]
MTTLGADNPARGLADAERGLSVRAMIGIGAVVVAFVGLFFRWFYVQHLNSSTHVQDWGHAYLVPLFSGYLVWQRREELRRIPIEGFWPGLAPVLLGLASYFFCVVGIKNHMLQGFSIVLTIFGLCLLLLGPRMMRLLFVPIAFLCLGITVSEIIMITLTFPLQLLASQGGYVGLSVIGALGGFTADVSGNTITVVGSSGFTFPLNIAEACSGMRMVVAFAALGAATAVLSTTIWWQRVVLVLMAPIVAIFLNILRVIILGLLSFIDTKLASGEAHTFIGTVLLIPGLFLFLGIVWMLNKAQPAGEASTSGKPPAKQVAGRPRESMPWKPSVAAWIVAVSVLAFGAAGMKVGLAFSKVYLQKKSIFAENGRALRAIPTETANWVRVGQDHIESPESLEVLGTDNYLTRMYQEKAAPAGGTKRTALLHVAYYTGMIDTVPHVPDRCMIAAGMDLVGGPWTAKVPLDTSGMLAADNVPAELRGKVFTTRLSNQYSTAGGGRRVNLPYEVTPERQLAMKISKFAGKGQTERYAGYFFIANGGWRSSAEDIRLLAFDLRNEYAYYLKVQVDSSDVKSPEELGELAGSLLDDLLGEVMTCLPDWVKVEQGMWPPDNPRRPKDAK